jgi:radical SAM family uncharacterized protein/radical SAM-linked protein
MNKEMKDFESLLNEKMDWKVLLQDIEKPGRYTGGEWNEIKKDPSKAKAKVAVVFPDLYEVGMSYLGQKILYFVLNEQPSLMAERVFAPWIDFEKKLRAFHLPLFSLENKIPLFQFDILGFSLLYELNYSNILTILDLSRIPIFSSERDLDYPLVIAGGPAAFNPEPVADIFDLLLIGDGEEAFVEIVEKFMSLKEEARDKALILRELSKIEGVYVPSLYTPYQDPKSFLLAEKPLEGVPAKIEKRIHFPFHQAPFPEKIIVPNIKVIFDRVAVEVARGCVHKCRFCQASSIYFPPRVKSPSFVIKKILAAVRSTGYENASLAALSLSDYPYFTELVEALMERLSREKVSLSLSSLRPGGLTSDIPKNIIKVRKTGFTLAPEAGTERLRRVINKKMDDDDVLEAAEHAFSNGWKLLKLYFMIGLPTERDDDLDGIARLVQEVVRVGYKTLKFPPQINLSIPAFIPKPHTPFQWLRMEDEEILKEKYRFLKSSLKKYPFVKFKKHPLKNSILEAIFSRGDRRLSHVLSESWERGARFDSWSDCFNFGVWEEAFKQKNIDYKLYLGALDRDAVLPWDHVHTGIKKTHLLEELAKALKEEASLSCLENKCALCQGCTFSSLIEREFREKIETSDDYSPFGKKTENVLRYRAFYSKEKEARWVSHLDLINIIQRAFRRASIPLLHSEGFHPKMIISYLPALPLGMEGKSEVLEFKSDYLFSEKNFIERINGVLPKGIKFSALKRMESFEPTLNEEIKSLVYSVDLECPQIREALEKVASEKEIFSANSFRMAEELVRDFFARNPDEFLERIFVDEEKKKLFLYLKHFPQKEVSPQKIVKNIFRVESPALAMAREEILFARDI